MLLDLFHGVSIMRGRMIDRTLSDLLIELITLKAFSEVLSYDARLQKNKLQRNQITFL